MPDGTTAEKIMFSAGDMVTWRLKAGLKWLAEQMTKYGPGPFRVAREMTLDEKSRQLYPADAHPQAVFIDFPGEGEVRFSGNYFEKV